MKSISKLHAEAIEKAKTEQAKVKAAAVAMIETPMELIKAILLKHEQAVIDVMFELSAENAKLKNREWVGLTDEEREYLWGITPTEEEDRFAFVLAVEAKLKEKNS